MEKECRNKHYAVINIKMFRTTEKQADGNFKYRFFEILFYDRTKIMCDAYNLSVCPKSRQTWSTMARIIDGAEKNLIGPRVRELRILNGMSQQELSDKLEILAIYICRGSVSRIEDQLRTVTDIERVGLSQVLGVSIAELFPGDETES